MRFCEKDIHVPNNECNQSRAKVFVRNLSAGSIASIAGVSSVYYQLQKEKLMCFICQQVG